MIVRQWIAALLFFAMGLLPAVQAESGKEAPVKISDAWVRVSVPGSHISAAYMTLTAQRHLKLISAETAVAGRVEIHNMTLNDGVMSMAPVDAIDLAPNKTVTLKPGGLHVMLMDIKNPLKAETPLDLFLIFEDDNKTRYRLPVKAKAR